MLNHQGVGVSSNELSATTNWTNGIVGRTEQSNVVRLFCFPHAGGGASVFRSWTNELAPGIEVYPIQLPGREGRWLEPPLTRMSLLVPQLSEALRPLLHAPYAFFGHSMGAFVAFELSRQLRRENRPGPAILIVSGARAPQIPDPDPPVHMMSEKLLLEDLKRFDGISEELLDHPELVSLLLPTLRADLTMCETYVYRDEPPLACPVSVYGGQHDAKVAMEHLTLWKVQTAREFQLRVFPGKHFYFLKESRSAVVQTLREELLRYVVGAAPATGLATHAQFDRVVADVWSEVLHVPHVGLDDNFFDLGGNSLLMVQAYVRLREVTSTTLSVLDLFRYPTIRLLAGAMSTSRIGAAGFAAIASTQRPASPKDNN
jgi:surfactin synthase thioesterase subunit